jgi:hypothetical protein
MPSTTAVSLDSVIVCFISPLQFVCNHCFVFCLCCSMSDKPPPPDLTTLTPGQLCEELARCTCAAVQHQMSCLCCLYPNLPKAHCDPASGCVCSMSDKPPPPDLTTLSPGQLCEELARCMLEAPHTATSTPDAPFQMPPCLCPYFAVYTVSYPVSTAACQKSRHRPN